MIDQKKIHKQIEVHFPYNWNYGKTSIEQMEKDLAELKANGATHVEIDYENSYDDYSIVINAYYYREETDEEFAYRIADMKNTQERQRQYELKQLEELKKKYES